MKKAAIRRAVAAHLAQQGYSQGWYAWFKPGWLEVYDGKTMKRHKYNIPAGAKMTKARLEEILSGIEHVGPPRALLEAAKDDGGGVQYDLSDRWGGGR